MTSKFSRSAMAGLIVILLGIAGRIATGNIYSSAKALDLIGAVQSSGLYLGSAMATSSGTILALMLTFLGFVHRTEHHWSHAVYHDILVIGRLSTLSLIGSVLLLLIFTLPIGDFENVPPLYFEWMWNVIFALVVAMSALLVGNVVMLYLTLSGLLRELTPNPEDRDREEERDDEETR